jgi:hypothetical protein
VGSTTAFRLSKRGGIAPPSIPDEHAKQNRAVRAAQDARATSLKSEQAPDKKSMEFNAPVTRARKEGA